MSSGNGELGFERDVTFREAQECVTIGKHQTQGRRYGVCDAG